MHVIDLAWHPSGKMLATLCLWADGVTSRDTPLSRFTVCIVNVVDRKLEHQVDLGERHAEFFEALFGSDNLYSPILYEDEFQIDTFRDRCAQDCFSLAWNPSGMKLAASCKEHVYVVDPERGAVELELEAEGIFLGNVDWNPSGTKLVSTVRDYDAKPLLMPKSIRWRLYRL